MKYSKPHLTYRKQADQLINRGLVADVDTLITRLKSVNYYRLSGYWFPFRLPGDDFKPGTTLDEIWDRYTFDRQLRCIVIDAVERMEIAIRTDIVYEFSLQYGPFGYKEKNNFPGLSTASHNQLLISYYRETINSREVFVNHFKDKYGDEHELLPMWMAVEIMSFGMMLTFYTGLAKNMKRKVSNKYGIAFGVLESWLKTLNQVRNICAHHGRLWNRELGIKPRIPDNNGIWKQPVVVANKRIFGVLTILKYIINHIAPQSKWGSRLFKLLEDYPDVPIKSMGFPDNWRECPIWN